MSIRSFSFVALVVGGLVPVGCTTTVVTAAPGAGAGGGGGGGGGAGASAGVGMGGGGPVGGVVTFTVSPGDGAHPISPLVYGINGAATAGKVQAPLVRLGGNAAQPYNWEVNATNGGSKEGFTNRAASGGSALGGAVKEVVDAASKGGGMALITVPIGDHVAADTTPGDVHASGAGYLDTRFKKNKAAKGAPFSTSPSLGDDSVYQDELVSWVKSVAGATPVLFALDNQPELWAEDHPEIHPAALTYADIIARDTSFAKAIKAAWPGVAVTGSVSYGWQGFMNLQNAPDANGEFLTYYLDQMKVAEDTGGARLLDYLDLHWWPEAKGGGVRVIEADASPAVANARVQAPRSLWDDTFHEDSWINDTLSGDTIHLIPRAKSRITAHYPGTKLAFSAWYFGGGADISGAIATADALGIFGREGVDLAALELPEAGGDDTFTLAGFSAFRGYDGAAGRFGDTSVSATSSDIASTSVYASIDAANPSHVVIVALNKRTDGLDTSLTIAGPAAYSSCKVYTLTAAGPVFSSAVPLAASGANQFRWTMPKLSVTVLVPQPLRRVWGSVR